MAILNKDKLIEEGFKDFDLTQEQKNAIKMMLSGYIGLLLASGITLELPAKAIKVYVDVIKSAITNCLNVVDMVHGYKS